MQRLSWILQHVSWAAMSVVLVAVPAAAQGSAAARPPSDSARAPYRARLLGVFDAESGAPVEGAEIIDLGSGTTARTTSTGTVMLGFLPDGGGLIRIRKLGYAMQTMLVRITPSDTVPVTVVLQQVVRLPEVITRGNARRYISPNLRGFVNRRRTHAAGYFVGEDELRKEDARTLANVLRSHVPGINLWRSPRGVLLEPSLRCQGGGPPDVYVDGVPWPHPLTTALTVAPGTQTMQNRDSLVAMTRDTITVAQPIDLSDFQVMDLAGIEYYPDALLVPMEFHHTMGACGALLLWTRER